MEYDLILARSVTYAQRMQRALNRAGIRSQLFRAPRDLTDLGCAYVVRISPYDLGAALPLLRREGLGPESGSSRAKPQALLQYTIFPLEKTIRPRYNKW